MRAQVIVGECMFRRIPKGPVLGYQLMRPDCIGLPCMMDTVQVRSTPPNLIIRES